MCGDAGMQFLTRLRVKKAKILYVRYVPRLMYAYTILMPILKNIGQGSQKEGNLFTTSLN